MAEQTIKAVVKIYKDKVDVVIVNSETREIINFFGIHNPEVIKSEEKIRETVKEITDIFEIERIEIIDERQKN